MVWKVAECRGGDPNEVAHTCHRFAAQLGQMLLWHIERARLLEQREGGVAVAYALIVAGFSHPGHEGIGEKVLYRGPPLAFARAGLFRPPPQPFLILRC